LKLEEYQYTIHFKPWVNNTNADALSRIRVVSTRGHTRSSNLPETQESSDFPESQELLNPQENQVLPEEIVFRYLSRISETRNSTARTNAECF